jgi:HK97 family phage prohead protease
MDGLLEFKSLGGSVKDIDAKKRIVTGYLSSFTKTPDSYGDVVQKGAFSRTIAARKNKVFFLNQHNWNQPHGKFNVLMEDDKGLYFESEPLIDTSYSSDALKLYEAGIVKEHSFGYATIVSDYDKEKQVRTLKEVKLFEGSNVTLGANPDTPFTGLKSKSLKEINDEVTLITKAMRNGTFTDDTFILLEVALKQLQLEAYKLGKDSLIADPPSGTQFTDNSSKDIEIINQFRKSLKL